MNAALWATHSDNVVSDHQPAARYCAASALVTAAASTPIARSYEYRTRPIREGYLHLNRTRCHSIAGTWLAAAALAL